MAAFASAAMPTSLSSLEGHSSLQREQIALAFAEGHDADLPSNAGIYHPPAAEQRRLAANSRYDSNNDSVGPDSEKDLEMGKIIVRSGDEEKDVAFEEDKEKARIEEEEHDPNLVTWDGPDDPKNPLNWSVKKKWATIAVLSANTFITPLASSIIAPGVPQIMSAFHSSNDELASFTVSVFILGYVFGPLVIAPMSEIYGRRITYNVANVAFFIFTVCAAVSVDLPMFIIFRFLGGFAGVTPLTIGGGTIADLMPVEKRGGAMAIWAMGPLLGPVIGPVIGGFLNHAAGWHWLLWFLAIVSGTLALLYLIIGAETYAPTLLAAKTKRLQKETGNMQLRSKFDTGESAKSIFRRAIVRPTKMLCLSPIVFLLSLQMAIQYGYLYLLFTTFTYVFEGQYHFSTDAAGLTFLGLGVGNFVGLLIVGVWSDRYLKMKKAQGLQKPEYRLPPLIIGAFAIPIGLIWYGWSAEKMVHWIVPIIGSSLVGVGLIAVFMPIQTYFVDAFTTYAASAIAANTVLRSLFGAVLPLAGQKMYATLGLGWGNTLLALIALLMAPVPFLFLKYGERIRTSPRFQLKL